MIINVFHRMNFEYFDRKYFDLWIFIRDKTYCLLKSSFSMSASKYSVIFINFGLISYPFLVKILFATNSWCLGSAAFDLWISFNRRKNWLVILSELEKADSGGSCRHSRICLAVDPRAPSERRVRMIWTERGDSSRFTFGSAYSLTVWKKNCLF